MHNQTKHLTQHAIDQYKQHLIHEEKSSGTVEKYLRDVTAFSHWLSDRPVTREAASAWKSHLSKQGYAPRTINSMVSALNGFFRLMRWDSCCVRFLKIQRQVFRDASRELSRAEYQKLVDTAFQRGNQRIGMAVETIGGTGIRVSELQYITVEAVEAGFARISLKGKVRVILIPRKLRRKLMNYARQRQITTGAIFLTRNGTSLSRRQIWAELKALGRQAGVEASKVFPHNLRHLFAKAFYQVSGDLVKLADVLGHSSMETTRIYLMSTGAEHMQQLEGLGLVS